jgi:hypothetical protein
MSRVDGHPFNARGLVPVDYASTVVVGVSAAERLRSIARDLGRPIF